MICTRILLTLAAIALSAHAYAQVFSTNTSTPIPDGPNAGIFNDINVSSAAGHNIRVTINITHPATAELDIYLVPPGRPWPGVLPSTITEANATASGIIDLSTDNGAGANFTNTIFVFPGDNSFDATQTATSVTAGAAPFTGNFLPEGVGFFGGLNALATYNGVWRLAIVDDTAGNTGTLVSWSIEFAAATGPELYMDDNGGSPETEIADGSTYILPAARVTGAAFTFTMFYANQGSTTLNQTGTPAVVISGQTNCAASVTTQPPATIAAGFSTTLPISCTPAAAGAFSYQVSIATNDVGENPFNFTVSGTAVAAAQPEIRVERPGNGLNVKLDGGIDEVVTTSFAGTVLTLIYTIRNQGFANLTLSGAAPVGTSALVNCGVAITQPTAGAIGAGTTRTFQLDVTPTAAGAWGFNWTFGNNDADENPYNMSVAGVALPAGPLPEANVRTASDIADGGTDIVAASVSGTPFTRTFTIQNLGNAALTTSGLGVSGMTNCSSSVVTAPPASIAAGGTGTFVIGITPTTAGAWSVNWSFTNNDANENPYNATTSGVASGPPSEMDLFRSAVAVPDGSTDTVTGAVATVPSSFTYTITNNGSGPLTMTTPVAAPGLLVNCTASITTQPSTPVAAGNSTTIIISVTPTVAGAFSCNVTIANNDSNENPYDWTISGTAGAAPTPEMDTTRGATPITDGGTDALGAFGTAGIGSTVTYTFTNSGAGSLTITNPATIGTLVNCGVTITTPPTSPIAASGNTTTVLTITPTAAGAFSFTYSIANNDSNENPYDWTVTGTAAAAPAPEMDVTRAATPIADGGADNVGAAFTAGIASPISYTITNSGTANLTLTNPATIGTQTNCTATITTVPTTPVAASGTTTTTITVTPTAAGAFSFTYSIGNNDANENPYNWTVNGTAVAAAPELDITRGATPVADGGTDNVGAAFTAGSATTVTYTFTNSGSASLTITNPAALGAQTNCSVSITTAPTSPVALAGTTTTVISITPAAAGAFSFTYSIANTDANENPYNWTVNGTAVAAPAPEMDVSNGAAPVADAGTDPLGTLAFGTPQTVTYTIANSGTAGLNLTGSPSLVVVAAVSNVSALSVTTQPATSVAAAGTTTFTVTFTITTGAAFTFSVSIANNDSNENPYDWTVSGTGASVPEIGVTRSAAIVDGGADLLGNAPAATPFTVTYTIANTGGAALTITTPVTVSGQTNCTATVSTQPSTSVAAAGSTTLVIDVTPSTAGAFTFTISITNTDSNENPYNWTASGTGVTSGGTGKGGSSGGGGCSTVDEFGAMGLLALLAATLAAARALIRSRRRPAAAS